MKKLILVIILVVIIGFTVGSYYFIAQFSSAPTAPTPSPKITKSQTSLCQQNQLSGTMTAQGAAGNIYAALELTNHSKTPCNVILGNIVTAQYPAKNIVINYKQKTSSQQFLLEPLETVYSQIHYPNGPQCQGGIAEEPVTFMYKTNLVSVDFQPTTKGEKLQIPACDSPTEKTVIDIWPLSQNPISSS